MKQLYKQILRAGDICILVYLKGRNAAVGKEQQRNGKLSVN